MRLFDERGSPIHCQQRAEDLRVPVRQPRTLLPERIGEALRGFCEYTLPAERE